MLKGWCTAEILNIGKCSLTFQAKVRRQRETLFRTYKN